MTRADLPENVVQFLIDHIDSVPHLEMLLLMWRSAPAAWSAEQLAARIYVPPSKVNEILEDFQRQGFVVPTDAQRYTYVTDWDRESPVVAQVDESYRTHLIDVSELLHSKGSNAVREFARAFRLKRDDK